MKIDKKSVFVSVLFGIISFIIAFTLGSILTITTGIPLVGGLLNGIFTGVVLTIGILSRKHKLNATIMWISFAIFASITTTLGPPGIYKILIGFTAGIIWDICFSWIGKYKRWGLYVGGLLGSASIMVTMVVLLKLGFGDKSTEVLDKYLNSFWLLLFMNLIITLVGLILGEKVYSDRLKKLNQFINLEH